jgi:hypothetical protein
MFLRAEKFDMHITAQRIVLHFEKKLELFGRDKVGRDILFSDLTQEEVEWFKCGNLQPLLQRDRVGRQILFSIRNLKQQSMPLESRVSLLHVVVF